MCQLMRASSDAESAISFYFHFHGEILFTDISLKQSLHIACVISTGSPSQFKPKIFPIL